MGDIEVYIIVLVVVLLIAYLINRNQSVNSGGPYDYGERGDEEPRYDSRDIEGQGSFGRNRGSSSPSSSYQRRNPSNARRDNPNIQGQGSFGRDKD
jgi:hypothetical protein